MTQNFTCAWCGRTYVSGDVIAKTCCLRALETGKGLEYVKNTTVKPA